MQDRKENAMKKMTVLILSLSIAAGLLWFATDMIRQRLNS